MSGGSYPREDLAVARYSDGTAVHVGDRVLIERGRTPGIVECVLLAPDEIAASNVDEPGLMLLSAPFGRVFWPLDHPHDPVIFIERGEPPTAS